MKSEGKVLLVTGRKAEELVRDYSSEVERETKVEVFPISVASFMSLSLFLRELEKEDLEDFSMILTPGLANFDLREAEDELGTSVFKGPKHAADLPLVLEKLPDLELSKERPASDLLEEETLSGAREKIEEVERRTLENLDETKNFRIGEGDASVIVGEDFPPRIVGEIVDAPRLSNEEITDTARKYVDEGAEILDIGMVAGEELPGEIPRIISTLRENFDMPLSIDTTLKSEIEKAIENDIDLVVSIDESTIEKFRNIDIPTVIIPRNPDSEFYPTTPQEKIDYLEKLLKKADDLGYEKPIGDPILEPINQGFTDSLNAFYEMKEKNPEASLFMGIGNAIELFDADSIGMTALLLGAASEINVDFVLSVEASDKTQGNISEIRTARDMMLLARERKSVPKDLGLDLLKFKEKRRLYDPYDEEVEGEAEIIRPSGEGKFPHDPKGFFKIFVKDSEIIAVFHGSGETKTVIKGETAEEVCSEIVKRDLVSELSHAAYLGRELQKAEVAMKTGRGYIQEGDVF